MKVASTPKSPPLWEFFLYILVFSIPFWLLGWLGNPLPSSMPIDLPISSLMAPCPVLAAVVLTHLKSGPGGVKKLLLRTFDYRRIARRRWCIPTVFLMPVILFASYWVLRLMGSPLPRPTFPLISTLILLPIFFLAAAGEELGWSGYAIDPIQARHGALRASIVLGIVWALWHVPPYIQAHHTPVWIMWQCFNTVGLRVLIVWIYNNTNRSVFAAIVFHTMSNTSEFAFPNDGSHYNPAVTGVIIAVVAAVITMLWGANTLARFRYSPSSEARVHQVS